MNKEEPRIPRPLGFTYLAITIHKENNQEQKQEKLNKLKNKVIELYINSGMELNHKPYSLPELANYLNMDIRTLTKKVTKGMGQLADIFGKTNDETHKFARVMLFEALKKTQHGKALAEAQLRILMASQGDSYKPFISGEVNKAIANNTAAIKPLLELIKLYTDNAQNNPLINVGGESSTSNNMHIGSDEAIRLLNERNTSILTDGHLLEVAYNAELGTQKLPEVVATLQDSGTLNMPNPVPETLPGKIPDIPENPAKTRLKTHENRRQMEEGFDEVLDGSDFIL